VDGEKAYTPYSLKEYKDKKKFESYNYKGLGPNTGTDEWRNKKEKQDRASDFSQ